MHELSITRSIVSIALDEAKKHAAAKVNAVTLLIGTYSGAVPACVEAYFRILSRGTILEGAKLVFHSAPARIRCASCGYEGETKPFYALCPHCQSDRIRLLSGTEFLVESLEVE